MSICVSSFAAHLARLDDAMTGQLRAFQGDLRSRLDVEAA
jgi:hypothetical protein